MLYALSKTKHHEVKKPTRLAALRLMSVNSTAEQLGAARK